MQLSRAIRATRWASVITTTALVSGFLAFVPTAPIARAASTVHVYPSQNVQAKIDRAPSGTTFILHGGTYRPLKLHSGITLRGAAGERAVVKGATGSWDAGIWIKDATHVRVRHLVIRGNTLGIFMRNVRNSVIEDNVVTDNAYGLEIHTRTTGTVVRRNKIRENDRYLDPGRRAGGINLFNTYGGIRITGNRITGNDSVGVEYYGADDVTLRGNVIAGSADAIETGTDAGGACRHNRIMRNVFYHAHQQPEERGVWLRCFSRSLVANNTFYALDKHAIGITTSGPFSGPIGHLRILNNAMVRGRAIWMNGRLPSSVTIDYNEAQPCASASCPAFGRVLATRGSSNYLTLRELRRGTPYMTHGVSVPPRFVDAGAHDFHLRSTSPLVDRGTLLGISFEGLAPDLGRWERN